MTNIKNTLEKRLGNIQHDVFVSAVRHFITDSQQIGKHRRLTSKQALKELSTIITFFRKELHDETY